MALSAELQGIVEKIRKCLALGDSERNSNENEVETALKMARQLMDRHNLSMADVAERDGQVAGKIGEVRTEERSGAPNWEYDLTSVLDHLFGVSSFVSVGYPRYKQRVVFVGYESDVALANEVYKLLKLELSRMGLRWQRLNSDPLLSAKQNLVRRHKYLDGVVHALWVRAKEQAAPTADSAKIMGLVVRKDKSIDEWMRAKYPHLRATTRHSTGLHSDATAQGKRDGQDVSLNFRESMRGRGGADPLRIGHK